MSKTNKLPPRVIYRSVTIDGKARVVKITERYSYVIAGSRNEWSCEHKEELLSPRRAAAVAGLVRRGRAIEVWESEGGK